MSTWTISLLSLPEMDNRTTRQQSHSEKDPSGSKQMVRCELDQTFSVFRLLQISLPPVRGYTQRAPFVDSAATFLFPFPRPCPHMVSLWGEGHNEGRHRNCRKVYRPSSITLEGRLCAILSPLSLLLPLIPASIRILAVSTQTMSTDLKDHFSPSFSLLLHYYV